VPPWQNVEWLLFMSTFAEKRADKEEEKLTCEYWLRKGNAPSASKVQKQKFSSWQASFNRKPPR